MGPTANSLRQNPPAPPASARVVALRLLAQRRLTEAQLWARLARRGYGDDDVRGAVERCKADGYVDDGVFARLFIEARARELGDARLVAELVRRGIARDAAESSVQRAPCAEIERCSNAIEKIFRTRPAIGYPGAARALGRLGFPTALIYRCLRQRAKALDDIFG